MFRGLSRRTLDEDSDPELPQPLPSFVVYVWNLRGHNFCDDHPVLLVFGKSATPVGTAHIKKTREGGANPHRRRKKNLEEDKVQRAHDSVD